MHRRQILDLAATLPAAAWLGCRRGDMGHLRELRVAVGPYLALAPFHIAHESGYFRKAGLILRLETIPFANMSIPLLAGGKLDVAFIGPTAALLNAVAGGGKVRIIAGWETAQPGCSDVGTIYGHRRAFPRGLSSLHELKGKRIAIHSIASVGDFSLDALLAQAGMRREDVESVVLQHETAVAAVMGGHVQAMIPSEDFGKSAAAASPQLLRGPGLSQARPNFQYAFQVFGARLLDAPPEAGSAFLTAYMRGVREYLRGATPRFSLELARSNGVDPELVRNMCRTNSPDQATVDFESLREFTEWCVQKKYCPRPVNVQQLVDDRFLKGVRI